MTLSTVVNSWALRSYQVRLPRHFKLEMQNTYLVNLRGFAAKASTKALESVSALGASYNPIIEEDIIVSVDGGCNVSLPP